MKKFICASLLSLTLMACSNAVTGVQEETAPVETTQDNKRPISNVAHPDWARDAVIYQINTRQYSEDGNFKKVEEDLDRIKALGVDILWFMPIHPIGEAKRKGSLGSPYAVKDFRKVNPELGTLEDFQSLVDAAHKRDMKVIIDWVANHTAWDNFLINDHPDWYTRNAQGEMQHPPETDWVDVADLNYSNQNLRNYMTESLLYWVRDIGIDGYRCDVAGMVPTDFWNSVRAELDKIKPVFMLAEWQETDLHETAFNATYAWRWKEILQDIVNGKANALDMKAYYEEDQKLWPEKAMRMTYTSNHDQNTWDGTAFEIYGEAYETAIALQFVGDGIPLIYNGQEAANDKRLEFFEKDLINWDYENSKKQYFKDFVNLKTENSALHNAGWGSEITFLETSNESHILAFARRNKENLVLSIFNLSPDPQEVSLIDNTPPGLFTRFGDINKTADNIERNIALKPWEYRIYIQ